MGNAGKNFIFWIFLIVLAMGLYSLLQGAFSGSKGSEIAFSEFLDHADAGQVRSVNIQGANIEGRYTDGTSFKTYAPQYPDLVKVLKSKNVAINAAPVESNMLLNILFSFGPVILLVGLWMLYFRQMQGGGKAMGFGRSRARLLTQQNGRVTFDDVAGIDEAKDELSEIVDFLRDPQKFQKLGGKIPKGCLLVGPPGTGKTLLARAIAGEANVPFFSISGSDFVEMFVGVGASRVRDMFEQGKKNAPCLIFIDEIDAVGRHRGVGYGGGNDEREQTLNQLLVEMDGFEANEGVIIIAATNRADVLDPALLRPGRFDRQIHVSPPDIAGREKILKVHLRKVPTGPDVDARVIARGTPGFSGADLANLVNEAALLAARQNKKVVTMHDLEAAKDKVMMGVERKSMVMKDEEKRLTAYHEAGHAIVALNCPSSDPIHKATIIPRGGALGMVVRLPEDDSVSETREEMETNIAVAMGGRVAEELIFGRAKVTSGAYSDIQKASGIARRMVTLFGMSDEVGPLFHGKNSHGEQERVSTETARLIDSEIKLLVDTGYKRARNILQEHNENLHNVANALLEYETLTGEEIQALLDGKSIHRPEDDDSSDSGKPVKRSSVPSRHKKSPDSVSGDTQQA